MANCITKTTEFVKNIWLQYINEGSVAIDATVGNGSDTVFLSEHCRKVYGFEIQPEALEKAAGKIKKDNVEFFCMSHDRMMDVVSEQADIVVFNLGYLPGGDHHITTVSTTTVEALKQALALLKKDGLVSVMIYWGHDEGKLEREKIRLFAERLDGKKYHTMYLSFPNQKNCPPEVLLITKKTD